MALLLPVALLGLFYVFLILPKQRELKRHNALVASLEVGDEVMTGSGFYGTLTEIDADTVMVRLAPGLEVKLARRAVAAKVPEPVALDEIEAEAAAVDAGRDEHGTELETGGLGPDHDADRDTLDEGGTDDGEVGR